MGDDTTEVESRAGQKSSISCKKSRWGPNRKHGVCFGVGKLQRIQRH